MLTFNLYTADDYDGTRRVVHIGSAAVRVEEDERRPAFGDYHPVAVLTLATGDKFPVEDGGRTAPRAIAQAKEVMELARDGVGTEGAVIGSALSGRTCEEVN